MTVYVDEICRWPTRIRCFQDGSCHMTADTEEELHVMAGAIGLRRAWFQPHSTAPHYDLTPSKRALALAHGAVFVPAKEQARRRIASRASSGLARPGPRAVIGIRHETEQRDARDVLFEHVDQRSDVVETVLGIDVDTDS